MEIEWWRSVVAITAAMGQTLYLTLYMTFPWYGTFLGRALFINALTFAVMVDAIVMCLVLNWNYGHPVLVILYGFLAIGIWMQLTAFTMQRFRDRDQDRVSVEEKSDHHHGV